MSPGPRIEVFTGGWGEACSSCAVTSACILGIAYVLPACYLYVAETDPGCSRRILSPNILKAFPRIKRISLTETLSNLDKDLLTRAIRFYQERISPQLQEKFGDFCKFTPSCSEYGLEAIERYGNFRGGMLAFNRIMRCNPWSHGGYDPVQ